MKDSYDVIIIGGGIGGLVCGCYLTQAGVRVLIIEKNKNVGGCTSSLKLNGFNFDMGAHLIGGCDRNGLFSYYMRKLKLNIDFIKLNPFERMTFGNDVVEVPDNFDKYVLKLQEMFPNEKEGIQSFFDESVKIYKSYLLDRDYLAKYVSVTYQQFLEGFIKNKRLQGILAGQCPYIGLPPNKASVIAVSFMTVSYLRDGTYYARGGAQNLSDSISKKFIAQSGDIRCSTEVKNIKVENGDAKGVLIGKDDFIASKAVISNADATKTFVNMVGADKFQSPFIDSILKAEKSISVLQLHLAVDVNGDCLRDVTGWHYNSYDLNKCFDDAFYIFVPNLVDASASPSGKSVIQAVKVCPYSLRNWSITKKDIEREFLNKVEDITKMKLHDKVINKLALTPRDIETFTGNSRGACYGWQMSPDYIMNRRLSNIAPINNLFLVGHWTNPGCGVLGVVVSGIETGREVLKRIHE